MRANHDATMDPDNELISESLPVETHKSKNNDQHMLAEAALGFMEPASFVESMPTDLETECDDLLEPDISSAPEGEISSSLRPVSSFTMLLPASVDTDYSVDESQHKVHDEPDLILQKPLDAVNVTAPRVDPLIKETPENSADSELSLSKKKKKKKGVGFAAFQDSEISVSAVEDLKAMSQTSTAPSVTLLMHASTPAEPIVLTANTMTLVPKKKKGVGFASQNVECDIDSTSSGKKTKLTSLVIDRDESVPQLRLAATPMAIVSGASREEGAALEEVGQAEASPTAASGNAKRHSFTFEEVNMAPVRLHSAGIARGNSPNASPANGREAFATTSALKFSPDFEADDLAAEKALALGITGSGHEEADGVVRNWSRPSSASSTRSRGGDGTEKALNGIPGAAEFQDVTYVASAAQFRRIERANRRYSIACDTWCGIEAPRAVGRGTLQLIVAAFLVPLVAAVVCYCSWSLGSSDSGQTRALYTLSNAVVYICEAVLIVEAFSVVVCEIEFGIVVYEETPALYAKSMACAAVAVIILQQILYAVNNSDDFFSEVSAHHAWLWQMIAGFVGCSVPVVYMFFTHAPAMLNTELRWVFMYWLAGCFFMMFVIPVLYVLLTILYARYGYCGDGALGAILMVVFPWTTSLVKICIQMFLHWGDGRAKLFTGPILDVLVDTLHAAVLCLFLMNAEDSTVLAGNPHTNTALLIASQGICYIYRVMQLMSSSVETLSFCTGQSLCGGYLSNSRVWIKDSPSSTPTKYQIAGKSDDLDAVEAGAEKLPIGCGISVSSIECYPFAKQCGKLRDIASLQCSVITGAAISGVFVLFILIVSASYNHATFSGAGLWDLASSKNGSISQPLLRVVILFCCQAFAALIILVWMQRQGNALATMLYQLMFYNAPMLAAASTFAVLAILGAIAHGNGMNVIS